MANLKQSIVSEHSEMYDDEILSLNVSNEGYQAILDGLIIHCDKEEHLRIARSYCVSLSLNQEVNKAEMNDFIQEALSELV